MKKLLSTLTIILFSLASLAQADKPFEKKLFPDQKDAFKEAVKHYEEGDAFFNAYIPDYRKAADEYLLAYKFNPLSADLNYKIGLCYYNFDKFKMKKYFLDAYKLKPTVAPDVMYFVGVAYHI